MTSIIPGSKELPIDRLTGQFSLPWRRWLEAVNVALNAAGSGALGLAADITAIATALGSPDGTVANIPDQESLDVVIVGRNGVTVTGKAGVTDVYVELQPVEDSGVGTALLKITRDAYGRIEGTQAATTSDLAEGSNLYYTDERAQDAVAAAFAAGTQTGCTVTYNDASNSLSINVSGGGGGGAMTLVGTATVAGSAATTLTMSGLDLATDGRYLVHFAIKNATGSAANISLYYNSDTTATNYYCNYTASQAPSTRTNNGVCLAVAATTGTTTGVMTVQRDIDGNPRAVSLNNSGAPAAMNMETFAHVRNNTANVTSITLSSSVASSLAVGTYFKVYKVT